MSFVHRPKDIVVARKPVEFGATESFVCPVQSPKFKRSKLDMLATRLAMKEAGAGVEDLWVTTLTPLPFRLAVGLVVIELENEEDIHGEGPTRDAATQDLAKKVAGRVMEAWLHLKTLGMDRLADSMVEADENKNEVKSC